MAIIPTWTMTSHPGKLNLENLSWSIISSISKSGLSETCFNIGDEKTTLIGGEEYIAQIIGFNYDSVTDPTTYNNRTKAGITFNLKSVFDKSYQFAVSNNPHWENSMLRTALNDTIYNTINDDLRNVIVSVDKHTPGDGDVTPSSVTTSNKLFVLSFPEVCPSEQYITGFECTPYEYYSTAEFKGDNNRQSDSLIKYKRDGSVAYEGWWARNRVPSSSYEAGQGYFSQNGYMSYTGTGQDSDNRFVSFAFCV